MMRPMLMVPVNDSVPKLVVVANGPAWMLDDGVVLEHVDAASPDVDIALHAAVAAGLEDADVEVRRRPGLEAEVVQVRLEPPGGI